MIIMKAHQTKNPRPLNGARALGILALLVFLPLAAAPAFAKPLKIVDIDCADGDSINKALEKRDTELIINIAGICTEDVVVRRDRVTLRGTDPALDGIRAATVDDPFGATLFIRGARLVNVENLQLTGGKHAGLLIEDARRNVILRNLHIEGNQEVGLLASNALVVGFDLLITNNGIAGMGLSETAYLRCDDCRIADNPTATLGYGVVSSAGALVQLNRGSVSARFPLSIRFNSVAAVTGTTLTGTVAVDASGSAQITVQNATIDGSIRADGDSRIEFFNSQQIFNPVAGGNRITGASQMNAYAGTLLIGETTFDEFSNGMLSQASTLETLTCSSGSDAICSADVGILGSNCSSCP